MDETGKIKSEISSRISKLSALYRKLYNPFFNGKGVGKKTKTKYVSELFPVQLSIVTVIGSTVKAKRSM